MSNSRLLFLIALVAGAIFTRMLPHPPNFTALGATAIFAGATLNRRYAFWVPLAVMVLSDALIGFHPFVWAVYLAVVLSTLLGTVLKPTSSVFSFMGMGAVSAFVFFGITNFAVWAGQGAFPQPLYPPTFEGLIASYVAGLPWLLNMILGDIVFAALLVGAARLGEKMSPRLRPSAMHSKVTASALSR